MGERELIDRALQLEIYFSLSQVIICLLSGDYNHQDTTLVCSQCNHADVTLSSSVTSKSLCEMLWLNGLFHGLLIPNIQVMKEAEHDLSRMLYHQSGYRLIYTWYLKAAILTGNGP